jgi:hypothetical protein
MGSTRIVHLQNRVRYGARTTQISGTRFAFFCIICYKIITFIYMKSDEDKVYMKIIELKEIYNSIVHHILVEQIFTSKVFK